jgi:hypothetical protein
MFLFSYFLFKFNPSEANFARRFIGIASRTFGIARIRKDGSFIGFSPSRQVAKKLVLRILKTIQKTLRSDLSVLRPEPSGLRERKKHVCNVFSRSRQVAKVSLCRQFLLKINRW